jgi:hypothetical protein
MALSESDKNKLKRYGLSGLNKPKKTPSHPTKKGIVAVKNGHVNLLRHDTLKTLHEVKQALHTGRISFFGQDQVVLKNLHLKDRNWYVEGRNDNGKRYGTFF